MPIIKTNAFEWWQNYRKVIQLATLTSPSVANPVAKFTEPVKSAIYAVATFAKIEQEWYGECLLWWSWRTNDLPESPFEYSPFYLSGINTELGWYAKF